MVLTVYVVFRLHASTSNSVCACCFCVAGALKQHAVTFECPDCRSANLSFKTATAFSTHLSSEHQLACFVGEDGDYVKVRVPGLGFCFYLCCYQHENNLLCEKGEEKAFISFWRDFVLAMLDRSTTEQYCAKFNSGFPANYASHSAFVKEAHKIAGSRKRNELPSCPGELCIIAYAEWSGRTVKVFNKLVENCLDKPVTPSQLRKRSLVHACMLRPHHSTCML